MLAGPLKDARIDELIRMAKEIPDGILKPTMSQTNGHLRKSYEIECNAEDRFVVKLRQSRLNMNNFSVILGYRIPGVNTIFRLRRYNGRHEHTNSLEKNTFYEFHMHTATERYQRPGFDEDHFAVPDKRFFNLHSAIGCLLRDCGFQSPIEAGPLFSGIKPK